MGFRINCGLDELFQVTQPSAWSLVIVVFVFVAIVRSRRGLAWLVASISRRKPCQISCLVVVIVARVVIMLICFGFDKIWLCWRDGSREGICLVKIAFLVIHASLSGAQSTSLHGSVPRPRSSSLPTLSHSIKNRIFVKLLIHPPALYFIPFDDQIFSHQSAFFVNKANIFANYCPHWFNISRRIPSCILHLLLMRYCPVCQASVIGWELSIARRAVWNHSTVLFWLYNYCWLFLVWFFWIIRSLWSCWTCVVITSKTLLALASIRASRRGLRLVLFLHS